MPAAGLVASLFAFWLLMSGVYTPFLLGAGSACTLAVALFAWRMALADREGHPIHLTPGAAAYWPWLAKEILKSGWQVSRIILAPALRVSPCLVRFAPSQRTAVGLATHANSITLTPGTVTVHADPSEFVVHALTGEAAAGIVGGEMDRRASRFEGRR